MTATPEQEPRKPTKASSVIPQALRYIAVAQIQNINRHGVFLTDADVERHMREARDIHIAALERTPHPIDATLVQLHEWAAERIAVNLAARERGYEVERTIAAQERARRAQEHREQADRELRPMRTTADV